MGNNIYFNFRKWLNRANQKKSNSFLAIKESSMMQLNLLTNIQEDQISSKTWNYKGKILPSTSSIIPLYKRALHSEQA